MTLSTELYNISTFSLQEESLESVLQLKSLYKFKKKKQESHVDSESACIFFKQGTQLWEVIQFFFSWKPIQCLEIFSLLTFLIDFKETVHLHSLCLFLCVCLSHFPSPFMCVCVKIGSYNVVYPGLKLGISLPQTACCHYSTDVNTPQFYSGASSCLLTNHFCTKPLISFICLCLLYWC